jgi:hypothetical protein
MRWFASVRVDHGLQLAEKQISRGSGNDLERGKHNVSFKVQGRFTVSRCYGIAYTTSRRLRVQGEDDSEARRKGCPAARAGEG